MRACSHSLAADYGASMLALTCSRLRCEHVRIYTYIYIYIPSPGCLISRLLSHLQHPYSYIICHPISNMQSHLPSSIWNPICHLIIQVVAGKGCPMSVPSAISELIYYIPTYIPYAIPSAIWNPICHMLSHLPSGIPSAIVPCRLLLRRAAPGAFHMQYCQGGPAKGCLMKLNSNLVIVI